jgi:hypothetical protein
MLEPQSRATLSDQLRPPAGFVLSHAVGTTFTLSLDTALTVPLSFAAHRLGANDDPISILDAVRRAADRVDVFGQADMISIASPPTDLVAFLEPMVHPVAVHRGLFHPKVWFLEYSNGDEFAYRFICASRNLTPDHSWDVVVSLDGVPAPAGARQAARSRNAPLARLLRTLPNLAVAPLAEERRRRIEALADRWRDIEWTAPDDVRDIAFHVWGAGPHPQPGFFGKRVLVISPFVSDDGIADLRAETYAETYLVSRSESIDRLTPTSIDREVQSFVLDDAADFSDDDTGARDDYLSGLHAKTYVYDRQDGSHVFLGSLNATGAALHQNVEVLVELTGKSTVFGVEAIRAAMKDFLVPHDYAGPITPSDDEQADRDLERALRAVAAVRLHARVTGDALHDVEIWRDGDASIDPDVRLRWHLLTRGAYSVDGLPGPAEASSKIGGLDLADVTPFVVVTATDRRGDAAARSTVLLAELHDDPVDRREAVIARHLKDRGAFMRLLMLLLELGGAIGPGREGAEFTWRALGATASGNGLFETLVRAVGARHSGLADVDRIVRYITAHDSRGDVLPDGFEALWFSVWQAYQTLNARSEHG